ncbi:MAG: methyltransferase domain-containing protein [Thermoflexales bacterium]
MMTEQTQVNEPLAQVEFDYDRAPGHWILARMGKRVLRPGGRELTVKLVNALNISPEDDVVEFAPGLGFTAGLVLQRRPRSYIGIELDDAAAAEARRILNAASQRIIVGDVLHSGLDDACASVVYGEAMLTMQADSRKLKIVLEAVRLLRSGGRYGIHELCLKPDDIALEHKQSVQRDLAHALRVNARPLTVSEWQSLLVEAGLHVEATLFNPMRLLEPTRMVADEGLARAVRIALNILRTPAARRRILNMRAVFNRYADHLGAVAIVAVKR